MGKIILASSSPRRQDILRQNNYTFEIIPSPYVEDHTQTDFSYEFIENLASNKALAVLPLVNEPCKIIGADTVVVLDGKILGKPDGEQGAFEMLKKLSGRKHQVVTSVVVVEAPKGNLKKKSVTSEVEFEQLSDEQIWFYIKNFKPFDKAGSYGIQEIPDGYIKSYSGSLENIIGLCPEAVAELLK